MRILLISTYELGHQPLHLVSPAAALERAGHEVRGLDLAVERLDRAAVEWADAVAFSVPMHTAMRIAAPAVRAVRELRPEVPICCYGLYAPVVERSTIAALVDRTIAGEYEPALVEWAGNLTPGATVHLQRGAFHPGVRGIAPPLERYARLDHAGEQRLVGYVEASHGCVHACRHCPIPPVYDRRIRIVPVETVVADVEQLVAGGARHITFGDPDFLNGARHSLAVARAVHERFPQLTFDCTTKIEHILEHARVWPELRALGCLFVVTALECVDDAILARLDKGHTTADACAAIAVLREHGIEPRPSLMPFTPWTTPADMVSLVDFVAHHDLIPNVDPIQYTIRLLLPPGSLLLEDPEVQPRLGGYDEELLSYRWSAEDPAVDELQARLSAIVEGALAAGEASGEVFTRVRAAVYAAAGIECPQVPAGSTEGRPRLTEPWFC